MSQEAKVVIGIGFATIAIIVGAVFFLGKPSTTPSAVPTDSKILVRDDSVKTGSASAKVTLVEFGDYQCPACAQADPIVRRLIEEYKDRILVVFRNFPLSQHPNAQPAAEAAEAAGAQGKYWEMYHLLYENQGQWNLSNNPIEIFSGYAKDLGLDLDKFKKDVEGNKFSDKIQRDINDGNTLGINATPTFFLNGEKLVGVPSYDDLKSRTDLLLK